GQRFRRDDPRLPGLADARAVLRRDPGPVERRLALAEQVGMLAAGGLLGREPLQRVGIRSGVGDRDAARAAERHRDRRAFVLDGLTARERQLSSRRVGDRGYLQPLAVEDDSLHPGLNLQLERRRATDSLA